ncbi:MAG: hypothetical protein ACRBFS_08750 [Aureispira sp.]
MNFLLRLSLGLLILSFGVTGCQSVNDLTRLHSYKKEAAPKIDGVLQDWATPLSQAKEYGVFQYNLGHDKDNLYIGIRVSDRGMQQRIMVLGMTVYTDTTGKRKEKIGIGYPLPLTEDEINRAAFEASNGGELDRAAFNRLYATMAQEFELLGFVEEDPKERIRVSNLASKDLKTAMGFDQLGAMLIEIKIPFTQLYDRSLQYNEVISLGIKINSPAPNADEDPGLFDDVANPITSNGQPSNSLFQNNPQTGLQQPQQSRMRRNPNASLGTWEKIQLTPIPNP